MAASEQQDGEAPREGAPGDTFVTKGLAAIGVVLAIAHVWFNTFAVLPGFLQNGIHFAGFAFMCAIINPVLGPREDGRNSPTIWLDAAFGLLVAIAAIYIVLSENAIYDRGVKLNTLDWVMIGVLLFACIDLTRRTTGWIVPALILIALSYAGWWGAFLDNVFNFPGLSWETIFFRSVLSDEGMFGAIARISSTFVFMFILFGAFLVRSGAGDFVIDLARAMVGRMVGGPGVVAVIASGLTGTISGSAVANTASTGVITIPLMKRAGFPPKFAGGVEAAASTGGQLMPPIMGAGAFVMANYTQISYTTIVAVSFLPAVMYFATVAFFVRVEAKRHNLRTLEEDQETVMQVMKRGGFVFLLPIALLVTLLVLKFTPTYAAGLSILAVIAASWLTPEKMGVRAIMEAMVMGARTMVTTAVLLCSIGLVVNVIAMTGVGNTFSLMITNWAGDNLVIAIALIALVSLVLGMGLPVTAAYIVLATLSAPALFNLIADGQLADIMVAGQMPEAARAIFLLAGPDAAAALGGPMTADQANMLLASLPPDLLDTVREQALSKEVRLFALLSAHMIIFWLSQDSNVTPPVCLTAFTAAAIAGTPQMATGVQSWKIAKGLYIVPLLFAYTPFLGGEWYEVAEIFGFGVVGLYAFTGAVQGHLENRLNPVMRILMAVASALLLWPADIFVHVGGLALFAVLVYLNIKAGKTDRGAAQPA